MVFSLGRNWEPATVFAVLISNPWFQANAQGAKARFQGWKNPTERRGYMYVHMFFVVNDIGIRMTPVGFPSYAAFFMLTK